VGRLNLALARPMEERWAALEGKTRTWSDLSMFFKLALS
jgi:hypothetical protein